MVTYKKAVECVDPTAFLPITLIMLTNNVLNIQSKTEEPTGLRSVGSSVTKLDVMGRCHIAS